MEGLERVNVTGWITSLALHNIPRAQCLFCLDFVAIDMAVVMTPQCNPCSNQRGYMDNLLGIT